MSMEVENYLINLFAKELLSSSIKRPEGIVDSLILLGEVPNTKEFMEALKKNGDYYLSIAGFVPQTFCGNKLFDFEYHLLIGRYSYYNLHLMLKKDTLFKDLSYDFLEILLILNEAFDEIKINSDAYLLENLEAWNLTRHKIFKKKLIRMGLNLDEISE